MKAIVYTVHSDFADHHDFLPVASPPYWPRVKGKVKSQGYTGGITIDIGLLAARTGLVDEHLSRPEPQRRERADPRVTRNLTKP